MKAHAPTERARIRRAVVVGVGRAGLAATLELVEHGVPVLLIAEAPSLQANSARDREGFNAASFSERDSAEQHAEDTRSAGSGLASEAAVRELAHCAPEIAEWLAQLGVPFARHASGGLRRVKLEGASRARTLFAGASSGRHIVAALNALVESDEATPARDDSGALLAGEKLVRRLEYWRFVSLVQDDARNTVGVLAQDCRTLVFKAFPADGVVLASGDYAGLQAGSAASSRVNGAALGACYRQGAVLSNLEFLQQHPLVVVRPEASVALPELVRSFGARLTHRGKTGLGLDLTGLEPERLEALWTSLGEPLQKLIGVDARREPIPVETRALCGLGGLWVDFPAELPRDGFSPRLQATNLPGLYAAGAADAAYHGARALPGNLAVADICAGRQAARAVVCFRESLQKSAFDLPKSVFEKPASSEERVFEALFQREPDKQDSNPHALFEELRASMTPYPTNRKELERLDARLEQLSERAKRVAIQGSPAGHRQDALLLASLPDVLALARASVKARAWREESRGEHQRSDFSDERAGFARPSLIGIGSGGDPETLASFDYACAGQNVRVEP